MGQCLSVQEAIAWQRATIQRKTTLRRHRGPYTKASCSPKNRVTLSVQLANGDVHHLSVYTCTTFTEIDSVVQREIGRQPRVIVKGHRIYPWLMAQYKGVWMPISPGANVGFVGERLVKYPTTEDVIRFPQGTWTPEWCSPFSFAYGKDNLKECR